MALPCDLVEEEYCLPSDARGRKTSGRKDSSPTESVYSEPTNSTTGSDCSLASSILNHHPSSLFERVRHRHSKGAAAKSREDGSESDWRNSLEDSTEAPQSLCEQPWFHRGVGRQLAEALLRPHAVGAFLVRACETDSGQFSLSLRCSAKFVHMRIQRNARGQFVLGQYSQPFASVPLMVRHYASHVLPIRGLDSIILGSPVVAKRPGCP